MALSPFMVKDLVHTWFRRLTDHAPLEEIRVMLSETSLTMRFPEATLHDQDEFRNWYTTVTTTYFDQIHELKMLDVSISRDVADVRLVVNWQARTWVPPAGYSKWVGLYAHQTWRVVEERARPVIANYSVDQTFEMQGPAPIRI